MPTLVNFLFRDYSDEYSPVKFNVPSVDETTWVSQTALITTLRAAVNAISLGSLAYETLSQKAHVNDVRPASAVAQRELGLRLFIQDTVTGKKTHVTIPAPDLVAIAPGGDDSVDLTLSVAATLIAAIEAVIVSEMGNPVSVYRGEIVGRSN